MSENSKEIHSVSWAEKIREKKFLHQNDNKKVLVIEDDACMRMLMQRKLERHGFQVSFPSSFSYESITEEINNNPYSYIITDYRMNGISGIEVLSAVQEKSASFSEESQSAIKCILVTSDSLENVKNAIVEHNQTSSNKNQHIDIDDQNTNITLASKQNFLSDFSKHLDVQDQRSK